MAKIRGGNPTISGHLGTISVPDVMGFLTALHHGGALDIDSPEGEITLYLKDGVIVGGQVRRGGVDTAAFLLRRGRICTEDLELVRGGEGRGDLLERLVDAGCLGADDATRAASEELAENLLRLFNWTPGEFRFYEGLEPPAETRAVKLEIEGILIEAARRCGEWSCLPSIYARPETRFELRAEPKGDGAVALDLNEWRLFYLVTNRRQLKRIWKESPLGKFETSRTLFGLASARLIQPLKASADEDESAFPEEHPGPGALPPPPTLRLDESNAKTDALLTVLRDPEADTQPVLTRPDLDSHGPASPLATTSRPSRLRRAQIHVERAPRLIQRRPGESPLILPLAGEKITIGRSVDNHLILSDGHVSGHHARILREGHRFEIEDTQSSNGIRVDGRSVLRCVLKGGEEIEIYPYTFRFEMTFTIFESSKREEDDARQAAL